MTSTLFEEPSLKKHFEPSTRVRRGTVEKLSGQLKGGIGLVRQERVTLPTPYLHARAIKTAVYNTVNY